jgi:hypothetical protein
LILKVNPKSAGVVLFPFFFSTAEILTLRLLNVVLEFVKSHVKFRRLALTRSVPFETVLVIIKLTLDSLFKSGKSKVKSVGCEEVFVTSTSRVPSSNVISSNSKFSELLNGLGGGSYTPLDFLINSKSLTINGNIFSKNPKKIFDLYIKGNASAENLFVTEFKDHNALQEMNTQQLLAGVFEIKGYLKAKSGSDSL